MAHDDFYLVKLAHLHEYIQERTQQAAFAIADNALYHNTFLSQCSDRLRVERIGFPLNYRHCQGALAASVVEDHGAPLAAEISGVHDEVHGCLWQRAIGLCSSFGKVTADGFDTASMLLCKLCGGLLAFAVALGLRRWPPMNWRLQEPQWYCCFPSSRCPFFLTCLEPQKKHFLCSKVLTSRKALQRKGYSDF